MLRTTARAAFIVDREAARHVRPGGSIVNLVGSVTGSTHGAYAGAAAAIEQLSRTLAVELRERSITVNAVSLDVERPCVADYVADTIVYLLSDGGHSITGQVIHLESSRLDSIATNGGPNAD